MLTPNDILNFWFKQLSPKQWFTISDELDQLIKMKFLPIHLKASQGELYEWRSSAQGRLAEIIILDQFSRNIFRGSPKAFAQDSTALVLAQEMVSLKMDTFLPVIQRAFAYLPYMHSESSVIHTEALKLFALERLEDNYKFEKLHKEIIDRFGRYPHRNAILERSSTQAEVEFLKTHSGF
jgi:uncharacterized protein (DUF924 family)